MNVLKELPTLATGQCDDLKFDNGKIRVWISRMTREDGADEDNAITVEKLVNGRWELTDEYDATIVNV